MHRNIFLLIFIFLVGCTGNPTVGSGYLFRPPANKSTIFFSLTNNHAHRWGGINATAPRIVISKLGGGKKYSLSGHAGTLFKKHLENESGYPVGLVLAAEIEPGTYYISLVDSDTFQVYGRLPFDPSKELVVTFDAPAGEIIYIGNINIFFETEERQFVVDMRVHDESERDYAFAQNYWPAFDSKKVVKKLAKYD